MSSYFDEFDREVYALSSAFPDAEDFAHELAKNEQGMIRHCEHFAGDMETPEDVRQCVMAVISLAAIKPCDTFTNEHVKEMAMVTRTSQLSRDMHGLFHDIARMRYQFRYGMVFDNPAEAVNLRDKNAEQKRPNKVNGKTHPSLKLSDAPAYCRKVIKKLGQ